MMRAGMQVAAIFQEHDGIIGLANLAAAFDDGLENRAAVTEGQPGLAFRRPADQQLKLQRRMLRREPSCCGRRSEVGSPLQTPQAPVRSRSLLPREAGFPVAEKSGPSRPRTAWPRTRPMSRAPSQDRTP